MFKRRKKAILSLALALSLIVPMSAYVSASTEDAQTTNQDQRTDKVKGYHGHKYGKKFFELGFFSHGIHKQTYFTLLIEKYAPERLAEWEPILKESTRLHEELRSLYEAKPELLKGNKKEAKKNEKEDQWKAEREQQIKTYQSFDEAIRSQDAAKIKTALEQLLPRIKQQNERMAERIAELKNKK